MLVPTCIQLLVSHALPYTRMTLPLSLAPRCVPVDCHRLEGVVCHPWQPSYYFVVLRFHTDTWCMKPTEAIDKQKITLAVLSGGRGVGKSRLAAELPALVLKQLQAHPAHAALAKQFVPVEIRITFTNSTNLCDVGEASGDYLVAARALYSLVHRSLGYGDGFSKFLEKCTQQLPDLELGHVIAAVAAKCHEQASTRHRPIFLSIAIDEAHQLTEREPIMRVDPR